MKLKNRSEIASEYKWRLEDIFPSDEAWEECFFAVREALPRMSSWSGKLSGDDDIYDCLRFRSRIGHDLSRLYQYARMRSDEDTRVTLYQGMAGRA